MISLPHRSMIELSPPELVRVAARAGFDGVGFPLLPVLESEPKWRVLEDTAVRAETLRALEQENIGVLDVELVTLRPEVRTGEYLPLFEAAAQLGAQFVTVTTVDDDEARVTAHFAALCAEAAQFSLRLGLEFMKIASVARSRQPTGSSNCRASAGGVLVDSAHFYRSVPPRTIYATWICAVPLHANQRHRRHGDLDEGVTGQRRSSAGRTAARAAGGIDRARGAAAVVGRGDAQAFADRAFAATRAIVSAR